MHLFIYIHTYICIYIYVYTHTHMYIHTRGIQKYVEFSKNTLKAERSVNKVMATVFWDQEGVVLVDFLEGQKMSQHPIMLKF